MTPSDDAARLHLYGDLADWFPLITAPEEYAEEASQYAALIDEESGGTARTVLELGSGGGNNASHMKRHFALTLVDVSPEMLAVSRRLNPECEHLAGDMRSVRLERVFDAVFVHDAIAYITTEDDLARVAQTAAAHLEPGGVAVFVPDAVRERFASRTEHGGADSGDRAARYLEWDWDPDPDDTTYFSDMVYLLRDGDGAVRVVHERHVCGLFSRDTWVAVLGAAGFSVRVTAAAYDPESGGGEIFVCVRR